MDSKQQIAGAAKGGPPSGRWWVLTAAVLWSTSGLFTRAPSLKTWPELDRGPAQAFWRAVFASLFLLPLVRRARFSPLMIPMAAVFAAMNYLYLTGMALSSPTNACWLQSTAPVWVMLISVLFLGHRPPRREWQMVLLAAAGVGLILFFELQSPAGEAEGGQLATGGLGLSSRFWGCLLSLASGVCYACVVLCLRGLREHDGVWMIALNHVVTAFCLVPFALKESVWPPAGSQWFYLAALGIVQMAIPYVLFARGLRTASAPEAATIGLLEPLLVPLWVLLAWGEPPAWWSLAGGGLILLGLYLRYSQDGKIDREPPPA